MNTQTDLQGVESFDKQAGNAVQRENIQNPAMVDCFSCGEKGHRALECRKSKKCIRCGLFGHISDH